MKGITVIVPTLGRPTLWACLESFAAQLQPQDEVIVVAADNRPYVKTLVETFAENHSAADWTLAYYDDSCWGHPAANHALDLYANTDNHIWRLDDDDQAMPDALDALREHLDDPFTVFRMTFGDGHHAHGFTCWSQQRLIFGNVGTPMIFAEHSTARFGMVYEGDWHYAQELLMQFGDPVWDERVVALIRPVALPDWPHAA